MLKAQEQSLETRQTQLFMQYFNFWMSPGYLQNFIEVMNQQWSDFHDYMEKYGYRTNPSGFMAYATIENFYGGLGVLVKRGLVDPRIVEDLLDTDIINYRNKMKPIVEGWRKQFNRPPISEWFEYLYDEMKKREKKLQSSRV